MNNIYVSRSFQGKCLSESGIYYDLFLTPNFLNKISIYILILAKENIIFLS